jgi:hypothetical protein
MSSERRVHDRHLLPGMAPLMGISVVHAGLGATNPPPDDDDALFDDALF